LAVLVVVTKGAQPPRLPLALPSILLGVVFALGLFSILPLRPPLAYPLWSYVPGAPASISLDPVGTRLELIKLAGLAAAFLIGRRAPTAPGGWRPPSSAPIRRGRSSPRWRRFR